MNVNFGTILKNLRISHNLDQKKMANDFNVNQATISKWEKMIDPPLNTFIKYAEYFNVSLAELFKTEAEKLEKWESTLPEEDLVMLKSIYDLDINQQNTIKKIIKEALTLCNKK